MFVCRKFESEPTGAKLSEAFPSCKSWSSPRAPSFLPADARKRSREPPNNRGANDLSAGSEPVAYRSRIKSKPPEKAMTSRGPKRSASRVSTVVQTWHEHKLERHRSERLDEEVIRHQTRVSDDTGSENMFQMWPPAPDHFEGVRKTPMSANEKQQILVVGKQFNSAPTIIKCQIEARRSRLRRARSAALPILIGLIQCATLIACSAQRPAANNEPSGQQRLTTGEYVKTWFLCVHS